ncbi:MAG: hypothetical protein ACFB51_06115 [Anaerolineae bacterium]
MSDDTRDFSIEGEPHQTPPMSDTERRRFQRKLVREQRRRSNPFRWYTVIIVVLVLLLTWFALGVLIGDQARVLQRGQAIAEVQATQVAAPGATATAFAGLTEEDLTATFDYVAGLATVTAVNAATDTPTPTATATVTPTATPFGAAGWRIVYVTETDGDPEIAVLDLATGERTILTDNNASDNAPRWAPDGERIAYSSTLGGGGRHIFVIEPDGSAEPRQLTFGIRVDSSPVWSPDGQRIAFRSVEGSRAFLRSVTLDGEEEIIIQLPSLEDVYTWTDDPELITIFGRTVENIFEVQAFPVGSAQSTDRYSITDALGDIQWVDFSPDGELVVFTATAFDPARRIQVFLADGSCTIINEESCIIRRLTEDTDTYFRPTFSPDGELLLVAVTTADGQDLVIMDLEGTIVEVLTEDPANDYSGDWEPIP